MSNLNTHEAFLNLTEAMQCTAAARAVAALAGGQVTLSANIETTNHLCDLIDGIQICLDAAIAAHNKLDI